MDLREGLSTLSKSSPYAVSTERKAVSPEYDTLKQYLFVETDIERVFRKQIQALKPDQILFLCGSASGSGGQSEVLTKNKNVYKAKSRVLSGCYS